MPSPSPSAPDEHAVELGAALDSALEPWRRPGAQFTLLFSGGVDSGLLAWELRAQPGMSALTVGRHGSPDLDVAASAAEELHLRWTGATIGDDELVTLRRRFAGEIDASPSALRAVFLSLAVALDRSRDRVVVCGQGADELFLGYAHYRGLETVDAGVRSREDLERLVSDGWPRTVRIGRVLGRTVVAPYLDPSFVEAARRVPIEFRLPAPEPKAWFRRWARERGLPERIAGRPKRALQYGTRIHHWLSRT